MSYKPSEPSAPTSYILMCASEASLVVNDDDDDDEMMMMSQFWVFDPDETFICYRGCLNLRCYISKKVQKNFLMGLKIW